MSTKVPIGISARHVHLSQADLEKLFGPGYTLTPTKPLSQPGQFACAETVEVHGPKGFFPRVRILGPVRKQTQVEIARSDAFVLGIDPPIRDSGDLEGTPGVRLVGPAGAVELAQGVIIAQRHLHLHTAEAEELGLKDKDLIRVRIEGVRALIFENVLVRVGPHYAMDLHLDTDEANAAGAKNGDWATILL
ncbi:MAG: phosphate propanoyltransferase [Bacillota bacterium]